MKVVISSGHGLYVRGASGYLDEVDEARRVVDRIAELLEDTDVECITFHDNTSTSQNANLNAIVNFHNAQGDHDWDVSVHFNAYDGSAHGTEVLYVTQSTAAGKLSSAIASAGNFTNRGGKYRSDLFFLNNTREKALLIETCFCDSAADAANYDEAFELICSTIAEAINGGKLPTEPEEPGEQPPTPGELALVDISIKASGPVRVVINGHEVYSGGEHSFGDPPDVNGVPGNQQNIIATTWKDAETAYGGPPMDDTELSVALPYRFEGDRPRVRVWNANNELSAVAEIRDVGPWLTDDNYWDKGTRPEAETAYLEGEPLDRGPNEGVVPNGAGIDLSPGLAKKIGIEGKGKVNFDFESDG
jgi:N-acetylmuramoyl-L-alanine amidase